MNLSNESRLIRETIKFPVRYDREQQTIWDASGMMVCDIRGWGKIQFMDHSEERQDAIGEKVAKLLNGFHEHDQEKFADAPSRANLFSQSQRKVYFEWD